MELLMLVGLCALLGGPVTAEVVNSFDLCLNSMYMNKEPTGFEAADNKRICQRHQNAYHFATLYNVRYRIPIWSAYTLDSESCPTAPMKKRTWFIEPQITSPTASAEMKIPSESGLDIKSIKLKQALSTDYEDTSYDRGHLNPAAFQCGSRREATFTLTNAAPMDPCFNRIYWYNNEKTLKNTLKKGCLNKKGIGYLVTGTVPSPNQRIPNPTEDSEYGPPREYNRVSIPTHIWTAVCCHIRHTGERNSFSFLAENKPQMEIQKLSVHDLEEKLKQLYQSNDLKIFPDGHNSCNSMVMAHLIIPLEDEIENDPPESP